jgi:hypothetical protein
MSDWPSLKLWDLEYMARSFGETEASTMKLIGGESYTDPQLGAPRGSGLFKESIASIVAGKLDQSPVVVSSVDSFPAAFYDGYTVPSYCAGQSTLRSLIFVGPKDAVTPMHQDMPENLYALINGRKRIILFSPSSPIYSNSWLSKIPNFSRVNPENPDYGKFPEFKKAQPYVVELEAGEVLFIPSFWWHHFRNLESSIALNFWWDQGWKLPIAWIWSRYKKLRKF